MDFNQRGDAIGRGYGGLGKLGAAECAGHQTSENCVTPQVMLCRYPMDASSINTSTAASPPPGPPMALHAAPQQGQRDAEDHKE